MANWAKKHFLCPLHMPIATMVAWDKEQQKDVVVEATNCKSKQFLKKAIANKLKTKIKNRKQLSNKKLLNQRR